MAHPIPETEAEPPSEDDDDDVVEPEPDTEPPAEDDEGDDDDAEEGDDDFGPPFAPKTFGGAFEWARAPGYVASVLRVREGGNVVVSTQGRRDMVVMLTGGRAVLEVEIQGDVDHVELMPSVPVTIDPDKRYRLIAQTEVEIFTVYSPL